MQMTSMLVIKRPSNDPLFSRPSWYSALRWSQNEGALAQHSYKSTSTGFTGKKVINWAGGIGLDQEQKSSAKKQILDAYTGIDGAEVIVSINDSPENSVIVDNIDPPNINATFVNYTEESERKLLIAHSYPEILLAGSKSLKSCVEIYCFVVNPPVEHNPSPTIKLTKSLITAEFVTESS